MTADQFSEILKILLQIANIVIIGYGLYKFLSKPHDNLATKVDKLEEKILEHDVKLKEVEDALHQGNDRFREQKDLDEVFINCMLSFIDFERAYCQNTGYTDTKDLDDARATLKKYLAKK